jgi:hypothetical protein
MVAVFFVQTMVLVLPVAAVGLHLGWDAPVYTEAARAWLSGGNPWATVYAFPFAGPPPSFLPYLPFVLLPEGVTSLAWVAIGIGSAVYVIRRLGLPWWWLLFPPMVLCIMAGSTALLVTALLVRGGVIADTVAVGTRLYAILPLVILGKWRSVIAAGIAGAVSLAVLPWGQWLAEREAWQGAFASGAADLSAASMPWLIPFAVLGLVLMGRERAAWLVVPVLWPDTQLYYAVIALPALVRSPLVALSLAIPIPGLVVVGMLGQRAWESLRLGRPQRQGQRSRGHGDFERAT